MCSSGLIDIVGNQISRFPDNYDPHDYINAKILDSHPLSYPNCGLYHKYDDLIRVYPDIINWPIETQIKYSDAITRRYCLNKSFLEAQNITTDTPITNSNTTAVGNVAIIAYYNGLNSDWGKFYNRMMQTLRGQ